MSRNKLLYNENELNSIEAINYSIYQPGIFLFTWLIFGILVFYPFVYINKKRTELPYKQNDMLFYYIFSAYECIQSHQKSEDYNALNKAYKFLSKKTFNELQDIIKTAYSIIGLDKNWLSKLEQILHVNEDLVLPRLRARVELEKILPIVGSFAQLQYSQKENNVDLQKELVDDILARINKLKPYEPISEKKQIIKNFIGKTYKSDSFFIRFFSFSSNIILIFAIIGVSLIGFKITITNEILIAIIVGGLGTSILGGIELAKLAKE